MTETKLEPIELQAVKDAIGEFTYGDVITKKWLYEHFEIELLETGTAADHQKIAFRYLSCVEKFKELMLVEHLMLLASYHGKGYIILMPDHQPDHAMVILKQRMSKEIARAMKSLSYVNQKLLSDDSSKKMDNHISKIAALTAFNKNKLNDKA